MEEFRPEYVQALDAARWNYWWYVAGMIPPLLLIPAAIKGRFGCLAFPVAMAASWLVLNFAVGYYWDTKVRMAETPAEINDAMADTARLFGPVFVSIPLVLVYVILVGGVVYGV